VRWVATRAQIHICARVAYQAAVVGRSGGTLGATQVPHCRITWNLIAQKNHGLLIPCGASIALANKLAERTRLPIGAMPCMGLLTENEYLDALKGIDVQEVIG
jgi:hypothetical protein